MIENIPTEGLYDKSYTNIMKEFDSLRQKQRNHDFEINMLGTNSKLYSNLYSIFKSFRKSNSLRRYVNYLLNKILRNQAKKGNVLTSYTGVIWTNDVVKTSSMPYPVRRVEYPWAILNSELNNKMKILDIGSGISLFPIYLASKNHEVSSLDNDNILMERISPQLAKWSGTSVNYAVGDVTNLNFEDNSFDRVFCISVVEHLEEEYVNGEYVNFHRKNLDVKAIGEMLRVLKPNGLLVLTFDWSENENDKRSYKLDDIYNRVLKPYRSNLIKDEKPIIKWDDLKVKHLKAGKSFPPYDYISEGWAMGVILKK